MPPSNVTCIFPAYQGPKHLGISLLSLLPSVSLAHRSHVPLGSVCIHVCVYVCVCVSSPLPLHQTQGSATWIMDSSLDLTFLTRFPPSEPALCHTVGRGPSYTESTSCCAKPAVFTTSLSPSTSGQNLLVSFQSPL